MANLIITIIAIALTAILAIVGAYYGGDAIHKAIDKGRVSTIIKDLEQISLAMNAYALERVAYVNDGISLSGTAASWLTAQSVYLVPTYLSALPSADFYDASASGYSVYYINRATGAYSVFNTTSNNLVNAVGIKIKQAENELRLCTEFVTRLGEKAAYLPRPQSTGYAYNFTSIDFGKVSWICTFRDRDNSGGISTGDGNTDFIKMMP